MADAELITLRKELERIDRDLLVLLAQRMERMAGVARAKLRSAAPFRDPVREEQVLRRVREAGRGLGLEPREVERLFRVVMEMAIERQKAHAEGLAELPLRAVFAGVEGGACHQAARHAYAGRPEGVLLTSVVSPLEVLAEVASGRVDLGLLPIESTRESHVEEISDALVDHQLYFTAEILLRHRYRLAGLEGAGLEQVRTIFGDADSLRACAPVLRSRPHWKAEVVDDAAEAADRVMRGRDVTCAVVAPESTVRLFGLVAFELELEEGGEQITRFVEVARTPGDCPPERRCKSSLRLELANRPGALEEALAPLARHALDLSRIASRPVRRDAWHYRFYMDVAGRADGGALAEALEEIRPLTTELRLLGTYPSLEAP